MSGCESCTVCCKTMKVRELDKPAHVWCAHCTIGAGCATYETRPESCRVYECLWLKTQGLPRPMPSALRPDRCKVVMGTVDNGESVVLYTDAGRPDAWRQVEVVNFLLELKQRRVPVFLSRGENLIPL